MKGRNLNNFHKLKISKMRELSADERSHFNNFAIFCYSADLSLIILCLHLLRFQRFYFCKKFQLKGNNSFLIQEVETGLFLRFLTKK